MADRSSGASGPRRRAAGAAIVFAVLIAGGTLPIPLYRAWSAQLHFGAITTVLLFAAYAVGVVGALLLLGDASDRAGRRTLLLLAVGLGAASTVLFLMPGGVPVLLAARFLSGVATGVTVPAATAWIADLGLPDRAASRVSAACNFGGFAVGTVLAGALSQATGAVAPVFAVYLAMLAAATVVALRLPETVRVQGPPLPRFTRPALPGSPAGRAAFLGATLAAASAFAVNGAYSSLVPDFVREDLRIDANAVIGLLVALLFVSSLLAQAVLPRMRRARQVIAGLLVVGVAAVQASLLTGALPLFLAATLVVGAGIGLAVRRGLGVAGRESTAGDRAELDATYYLGVYLGLIVPSLVVGLLEQTAGRVASTTGLTAIVVLGSAGALLLGRGGEDADG